MDSIGIVYIARGADPNWRERVRRFVISFIMHPPGHSYRLYVTYKEFDMPADLLWARRQFSVLEPFEITEYIGWNSFGGGAFLEASEHVEEDLLCTLVSTTEVMHDNWLGILYNVYKNPGVGLVGCTGSREGDIHVRDTAIIVDREWYQSVISQFDFIKSKDGYLAFEHGPRNLTIQTMERGQRVFVVEKRRVIEPAEWPHTTYRGNLHNVLVHDRGARDFQDL